MNIYLVGIAILSIIVRAHCDTPANCTFEDVNGSWIFSEGERDGNNYISCKELTNVEYKTRITLMYPDIAVDQFGNRGFWTMVYNQGFEVTINGRSYFAFSYYTSSIDGTVTSHCDQTFVGWARDVTIRNWSCFKGKKVSGKASSKIHYYNFHNSLNTEYKQFINNREFIDGINAKQASWTATHYDEYEKMTLNDHLKRNGGRFSYVSNRPLTKTPSFYSTLMSMRLPKTWDWRNVSGLNYVSPIRNQGNCGSCYAFASMAALESQIRILTQNTVKKVFSPQDIVECSELSQGCDGGFPYLIAGRYAQDQGVVPEACNPYKGENGNCKTPSNCQKQYTSQYKYVGGYFGGCNVEEMMIALVEGGPLAVGFEVYNDFLHYKGGVYHYTGLQDRFNPLELTNHAVLLVGYGETEEGEKYWTVKNSWGTGWGEEGFFRIRRGNDECGIESMAVKAVIIP